MSFNAQKLFSLLPAIYRVQDNLLVPGQDALSSSDLTRLTSLLNTPPPLNPMQTAQLETLVRQSQGLLTAEETQALFNLQQTAATGTLTQEKQDQLAFLLAKQFRGPLGSILVVIAEQLAALEENLAQLYDDQFIETCSPWAIRYIGDLIGYQPFNGEVPQIASPRSDVGHTISFRRRKGTAVMLEEVARDVTGWGATAVEFFQRLGDTQYMNHIRPQALFSPDLRNAGELDYIGTAFDRLPHRVDVRRIETGKGRYNIPNIGIFLWRLFPLSQSLSVPAPDTAHSAPWRLWMSPLGNNIQLFTLPVTEEPLTSLSTPLNVADPIGLRTLSDNLGAYYGSSLGLFNITKSTPPALSTIAMVSSSQVQVCNLSDASANWTTQPNDGIYRIDPTLGRVVVPTGDTPSTLLVSFNYGFSADMGGGEYSRSLPILTKPNVITDNVSNLVTSSGFTSLQLALNDITAKLSASTTAPGTVGVVEIMDNGIYTENLQVNVPAGMSIQIVAADGKRPALVWGSAMSLEGGAGSSFAMNGLLISGNELLVPNVLNSSGANTNLLSELSIEHCTLVPGRTLGETGTPQHPGQFSLLVQTPDIQVSIDQSILGPIGCNPESTFTITNSILDATSQTRAAYQNTDTLTPGPGGTLTMEQCTVIGKVFAQILQLVSNSVLMAQVNAAGDLFPAPVTAAQRQEGCVRFSFIPTGSRVPRRFECQPPLPGDEIPSACAQTAVSAPADLGPIFTSTHYGDPGYCQMNPMTADAIRRGADNGGEMGAFNQLFQPQRESNLAVRLGEYLRVGLDAGVFYQT